MGAGSVLQADDYRRILLVVDAVERSPTVGALRETTLAALASLRLSPRERQVAALIAAGRSNAEIADELGIAESTVKKHVSRALGATGLRSRTQLAASFRGRRSGG